MGFVGKINDFLFCKKKMSVDQFIIWKNWHHTANFYMNIDIIYRGQNINMIIRSYDILITTPTMSILVDRHCIHDKQPHPNCTLSKWNKVDTENCLLKARDAYETQFSLMER